MGGNSTKNDEEIETSSYNEGKGQSKKKTNTRNKKRKEKLSKKTSSSTIIKTQTRLNKKQIIILPK